jgi:hypothetical protein
LALHEALYPEVISVKTCREPEGSAKPAARAVPFAGLGQLAPAKPIALTAPRCSAVPAKPIAPVGELAAWRMVTSGRKQHHASLAHAQLSAWV